MPAVYTPPAASLPIFVTTAHPDQVGVNVAPTNQTVYVETDSNHRAGVYVHAHNLQSDRDYAGGDTIRGSKGSVFAWTDVDNNDPTWDPIAVAGVGVQSIMQSGPTAQSYGSLLAYVAEVFIKSAPPSHGNEYSTFYSTMMAGSNTISITGGNYWFFDHALYGPTGQPGKLVGYSFVTTNHYNGSPSTAPSQALCIQNAPDIGGQNNNFTGLTTYPFDAGLFIGGLTTGGTLDGYTNAIQVGGIPAVWKNGGYNGDAGQVGRGVVVKAKNAGTSVARLGAFVSEGTGEAGGLVFGLDTADANRVSLYRSANGVATLNGNLAVTGAIATGGRFTWLLGLGGNALAVANDVSDTYPIASFAGSFQRVDLSAKTGPVGAALIIDILKSSNHGSTWSTIFSNTAHRPTIAAGSNNGSATIFDTPTFAAGDWFRLDIIQVGSTTAGSGLTVKLA